MEQYFLLHSKFNLNTLKVVNHFSGARSKSLYMYNKDFSELIYSSHNQEDFIFKLGIDHSTLMRSLDKGNLYLNKCVFSNIPIAGVFYFFKKIEPTDLFRILMLC